MNFLLRSPSRHAFTLVETLVAVGVIAVLAAFLFPAVSSGQRSALQTKCLGNLREVATAMNLYANESNGNYPASYGDPAGQSEQWSTWIWKLTPYVPTDNGGRGTAKDFFSCAAKPKTATANTATYGVNSYMMVGWGNWYPANANWSYSRSRIPSPSKTILVGDMDTVNNDILATSDRRSFMGDQSFGPGFRHGPKNGTTRAGYARANMAFCDGHVEALSPSELLRNPPELASNPIETRSLWKWW